MPVAIGTADPAPEPGINVALCLCINTLILYQVATRANQD